MVEVEVVEVVDVVEEVVVDMSVVVEVCHTTGMVVCKTVWRHVWTVASISCEFISKSGLYPY